MTRRQDTYMKLECNSGQTVPLILETGLTVYKSNAFVLAI